jgi:hypothetical protein
MPDITGRKEQLDVLPSGEQPVDLPQEGPGPLKLLIENMRVDE